jgi:hypothetical protein
MIHCIEALPVALIGPLIGGIASIAGTLLAPKPKPPPVPNVPAPPPPAQNPQGSQTSSQPEQSPSFLAAATTPQQGQTIGGGQGKTLLGQ